MSAAILVMSLKNPTTKLEPFGGLIARLRRMSSLPVNSYRGSLELLSIVLVLFVLKLYSFL